MKFFSWLVTGTIAAVLGVVWLRLIENRTIFYPSRAIEFTPRDVGLAFEEVTFQTTDNRLLNGWFVPGTAPAAKTILFCHGNAGNIGHRLEKILFFHSLGCNVCIFDYRGYGKSAGRPYEQGLYRDVRCVYAQLLQRGIPAQKIVGYGESLGGAVIVDLAAHEPLNGLIVESSMSSAAEMARLILPWVPPGLFASRFDSKTKVASIRVPKLIIHSKNDEIIPYRQGEELFAAAADPKEFLQVRGGHNTAFFESRELLAARVKRFLESLP